jgi:hypothetical protein
MDPSDKLDIRKVRIAWRRDDSVLVSDGLNEGDRVVVSSLPNAVQGMSLRRPAPAMEPKGKAK